MAEEEQKLPALEETVKELMAKIEDLEKEKKQYLENLLRAKNDVLRIKTEYEEKMKQFEEIANANLIYSLLNVLDSFELAFAKYSDKEIDKGFFLIYSQLKDILEKYGLEEINPLGMKFDPNYHETVTSESCSKENCDGSDEGLIVEVYSKGYFLKGRLLRPARVKTISH
ncbi:Protein GrpE [bacterium HR35]|nr:Protein GrpE [bacterium HR35]